ncbi:MAG: antitoxin PrlF [Thermoanaerobacteraceae bacterium]|jgi:AbrB family looped-hinge helix DNA binding protein|nr:antitoxin PrlF [Thermoanaerobacteraceae bacterium]
MELSRVKSNGEVIIPKMIRKKLNLKEGDKVVFIENKEGKIVIENAGLLALKQFAYELAPEVKKWI